MTPDPRRTHSRVRRPAHSLHAHVLPDVVISATATAHTLLCVLIAGALLSTTTYATSGLDLPQFSFAVIADVQYADKPAAGDRHYRKSLEQLRAAVVQLNQGKPAFTIQLGDFIDDGVASLDTVLAVYDRLNHPAYHVLGNHDFALPRTEVMRKMDLESGFYHFERHGWRFVVMDATDHSTNGWPQGSVELVQAEATLKQLKAQGLSQAHDWNGAVGSVQLTWLGNTVAQACEADERVVVFSHMPLLEAASSPVHLVWNAGEVLATLDRHDCVVAYFNGHAHAGGYTRRNGVHHLSFTAMLESPIENAFAVVHVYEERLEVEGVGRQPGFVLSLGER